MPGDGRLLEPPSRGSMWRRGTSTPTDINDGRLSCGGFQHMWERQAGKCGLCGDHWDGPRDHEAGGKFATGIILREYEAGQKAAIVIELTSSHGGYMEFRLCANNDVTKPVTQQCLDENVLEIVGYNDVRYYVTPWDSQVMLQVKLPVGLTCSQCVLQWKYRGGDRWGTAADGWTCRGCGPQEMFYGCADVRIVRNVIQSVSNLPQNFSRVSPIVSKIPTNDASPITTGPEQKQLSLNKNLSLPNIRQNAGQIVEEPFANKMVESLTSSFNENSSVHGGQTSGRATTASTKNNTGPSMMNLPGVLNDQHTQTLGSVSDGKRSFGRRDATLDGSFTVVELVTGHTPGSTRSNVQMAITTTMQPEMNHMNGGRTSSDGDSKVAATLNMIKNKVSALKNNLNTESNGALGGVSALNVTPNEHSITRSHHMEPPASTDFQNGGIRENNGHFGTSGQKLVSRDALSMFSATQGSLDATGLGGGTQSFGGFTGSQNQRKSQHSKDISMMSPDSSRLRGASLTSNNFGVGHVLNNKARGGLSSGQTISSISNPINTGATQIRNTRLVAGGRNSIAFAPRSPIDIVRGSQTVSSNTLVTNGVQRKVLNNKARGEFSSGQTISSISNPINTGATQIRNTRLVAGGRSSIAFAPRSPIDIVRGSQTESSNTLVTNGVQRNVLNNKARGGLSSRQTISGISNPINTSATQIRNTRLVAGGRSSIAFAPRSPIDIVRGSQTESSNTLVTNGVQRNVLNNKARGGLSSRQTISGISNPINTSATQIRNTRLVDGGRSSIAFAPRSPIDIVRGSQTESSNTLVTNGVQRNVLNNKARGGLSSRQTISGISNPINTSATQIRNTRLVAGGRNSIAFGPRSPIDTVRGSQTESSNTLVTNGVQRNVLNNKARGGLSSRQTISGKSNPINTSATQIRNTRLVAGGRNSIDFAPRSPIDIVRGSQTVSSNTLVTNGVQRNVLNNKARGRLSSGQTISGISNPINTSATQIRNTRLVAGGRNSIAFGPRSPIDIVRGSQTVSSNTLVTNGVQRNVLNNKARGGLSSRQTISGKSNPINTSATQIRNTRLVDGGRNSIDFAPRSPIDIVRGSQTVSSNTLVTNGVQRNVLNNKARGGLSSRQTISGISNPINTSATQIRNTRLVDGGRNSIDFAPRSPIDIVRGSQTVSSNTLVTNGVQRNVLTNKARGGLSSRQTISGKSNPINTSATQIRNTRLVDGGRNSIAFAPRSPIEMVRGSQTVSSNTLVTNGVQRKVLNNKARGGLSSRQTISGISNPINTSATQIRNTRLVAGGRNSIAFAPRSPIDIVRGSQTESSNTLVTNGVQRNVLNNKARGGLSSRQTISGISNPINTSATQIRNTRLVAGGRNSIAFASRSPIDIVRGSQTESSNTLVTNGVQRNVLNNKARGGLSSRQTISGISNPINTSATQIRNTRLVAGGRNSIAFAPRSPIDIVRGSQTESSNTLVTNGVQRNVLNNKARGGLSIRHTISGISNPINTSATQIRNTRLVASGRNSIVFAPRSPIEIVRGSQTESSNTLVTNGVQRNVLNNKARGGLSSRQTISGISNPINTSAAQIRNTRLVAGGRNSIAFAPRSPIDIVRGSQTVSSNTLVTNGVQRKVSIRTSEMGVGVARESGVNQRVATHSKTVQEIPTVDQAQNDVHISNTDPNNQAWILSESQQVSGIDGLTGFNNGPSALDSVTARNDGRLDKGTSSMSQRVSGSNNAQVEQAKSGVSTDEVNAFSGGSIQMKQANMETQVEHVRTNTKQSSLVTSQLSGTSSNVARSNTLAIKGVTEIHQAQSGPFDNSKSVIVGRISGVASNTEKSEVVSSVDTNINNVQSTNVKMSTESFNSFGVGVNKKTNGSISRLVQINTNATGNFENLSQRSSNQAVRIRPHGLADSISPNVNGVSGVSLTTDVNETSVAVSNGFGHQSEKNAAISATVNKAETRGIGSNSVSSVAGKISVEEFQGKALSFVPITTNAAKQTHLTNQSDWLRKDAKDQGQVSVQQFAPETMPVTTIKDRSLKTVSTGTTGVEKNSASDTATGNKWNLRKDLWILDVNTRKTEGPIQGLTSKSNPSELPPSPFQTNSGISQRIAFRDNTILKSIQESTRNNWLFQKANPNRRLNQKTNPQTMNEQSSTTDPSLFIRRSTAQPLFNAALRNSARSRENNTSFRTTSRPAINVQLDSRRTGNSNLRRNRNPSRNSNPSSISISGRATPTPLNSRSDPLFDFSNVGSLRSGPITNQNARRPQLVTGFISRLNNGQSQVNGTNVNILPNIRNHSSGSNQRSESRNNDNSLRLRSDNSNFLQISNRDLSTGLSRITGISRPSSSPVTITSSPAAPSDAQSVLWTRLNTKQLFHRNIRRGLNRGRMRRSVTLKPATNSDLAYHQMPASEPLENHVGNNAVLQTAIPKSQHDLVPIKQMSTAGDSTPRRLFRNNLSVEPQLKTSHLVAMDIPVQMNQSPSRSNLQTDSLRQQPLNSLLMLSHPDVVSNYLVDAVLPLKVHRSAPQRHIFNAGLTRSPMMDTVARNRRTVMGWTNKEN